MMTMKVQKQAIVHNHATTCAIVHLFDRWQDERGHEDIREYGKHLRVYIPEAHSLTGDPFGFRVTCSDGELKFTIEEEDALKTVVSFEEIPDVA